MNIFDFTDGMIIAHNALVEARKAFADLVEIESRIQELTERHRMRWILDVHRIEQSSPLMLKSGELEEQVEAHDTVEPTESSTDGETIQVSMLPVENDELKDLSWRDLVQLAKSKNIKTHGVKRPELEALLV